MKTYSFFGWLFYNFNEWLAKVLSRLFTQLGSGSVLQKVRIWANVPKVRFAAWGLLVVNFLIYWLSYVTSFIPSSYSLIHELLVYVCFFLLVIHKRELGIAIYAFYLPFLTYRPLLVLILIMVLLLFVDGVPKEQIRKILSNKFNIAIGLFMLILFLSSIASAGWEVSLKNYLLYYLTSLLLYFLILIYVPDKKVLRYVFTGLVIGGVMISVYAAAQYAMLDFTDAKWVDQESNPLLTKRVAATFGNPNIFAQYLVLVAPVAFIMMWYSASWRLRIYFGGSFLAILLALVLTFSRGAWAALFLAGLVLAFMIDRRLVILGIIGGAIGLRFAPDVILDRILSIFNTEDSSAMYRFDAWKSAFAMIRDYWITGIGMDEPTFMRVYPDYMLNDVRVYHFHNVFIQQFVTGGILGLFAVLFLFYQGFRTLVQQIFFFRHRDSFLNGAAKGLFASLLAIAVAGLTEDIWRHYGVNFTFWAIVAFIAVLSQFETHEGSGHES